MNAQWGNAQLRVYERALWSYERARVHNRDLMNARARSSRVHGALMLRSLRVPPLRVHCRGPSVETAGPLGRAREQTPPINLCSTHHAAPCAYNVVEF